LKRIDIIRITGLEMPGVLVQLCKGETGKEGKERLEKKERSD
jgi:hypothetical protein